MTTGRRRQRSAASATASSHGQRISSVRPSPAPHPLDIFRGVIGVGLYPVDAEPLGQTLEQSQIFPVPETPMTTIKSGFAMAISRDPSAGSDRASGRGTAPAGK